MPVVTIFDVAKRAGVSIKTVSLVMNRQPNVSVKTRERVLQAVEELGYRPNQSARSLAGSRSFLIGLFHDNPIPSYVTSVQMGAVSYCRKAGYHLMIEPIDATLENVSLHVKQLISTLRLDGLILTPLVTDNEDAIAAIEAAGTPYVRIAPGNDRLRSAHVLMDEVSAARTMTQHLLELGHREIGFVLGHPRHGSSHLRYQGFLDAMQSAGCVVRAECLMQGDFSFRSGFDCAQTFLSLPQPPTAIFCSNDEMALGVMSFAHRRGLSIPRDLSIAGFDDAPSASVVWPQLTTIRQPIFEMAETAAQMLIEGVASVARAPDAPQEVRIVEFSLIVRELTAPPRGRA